MSDLKDALKQERLAAYARLRGGFPVPLAGSVYWAGLALAGYLLEERYWHPAALFGTGAIFPLALLFSWIFKKNFMKDPNPVGDVLLPAFIGMLLFWPIAIAALWAAKPLFPLVLAIGMSFHWPVVGWSYGRTGIYAAHAIIRAPAVFYIWWRMPEAQLVLIPLVVAAIYLMTVLVIYIDSGAVKARLEKG